LVRNSQEREAIQTSTIAGTKEAAALRDYHPAYVSKRVTPYRHDRAFDRKLR